ncbi:hypothetical protein KI387_006292, partial [Taxus chinensis]
ALGFALFTTPQFPLQTRDALQGLVFDAESNSILYVEMEKTNLYVKRGVHVVAPDTESLDHSKRMRTTGDYNPATYPTPSTFVTQPAPVWRSTWLPRTKSMETWFGMGYFMGYDTMLKVRCFHQNRSHACIKIKPTPDLATRVNMKIVKIGSHNDNESTIHFDKLAQPIMQVLAPLELRAAGRAKPDYQILGFPSYNTGTQRMGNETMNQDTIFQGEPWFFGRAGQFMKPWHPMFKPDERIPLVAPIWVRLFGLPAEYWHQNVFMAIDNILGTFMITAETSLKLEQMIYARICVLMDLNKPPATKISLAVEEEIWDQEKGHEEFITPKKKKVARKNLSDHPEGNTHNRFASLQQDKEDMIAEEAMESHVPKAQVNKQSSTLGQPEAEVHNQLVVFNVWPSRSHDNYEKLLAGTICVRAYSKVDAQQFLCINVYSPLGLKDKKQQWQHLTAMTHSFPDLSVILGGDFNTIITLEEKQGGNLQLDVSSDIMSHAIQSLNLVDVPTGNGMMTWSNRRQGSELYWKD